MTEHDIMIEPNRKVIKKILTDKTGDIGVILKELKNLYEHWYREEIK